MGKDFNAPRELEMSTRQSELADLSEMTGASPDTRIEFETWLDKLRPSQPLGAPQTSVSQVEHPPADFVVECEEGTNCQISFEGVLHLQGLLTGSIHSEAGTLVAGLGIIEGDITVGGAAFIEGSVTGNIRAPERVLLHPGAKVWGDIISRTLSVKPGALFQGDCILQEDNSRSLGAPAGERTSEFAEQIQRQF
jgi:cytoskeletal protein CcmA (bactofilin family)